VRTAEDPAPPGAQDPAPLGPDDPAPPGQLLRSHGPAAIEWAASYLERVGTLPVLARVRPGEIAAALPDSCPEQPESFEAVLRDLEEVLLPGITHWQHPRYFAYFPAGTSEPAILAELLAATINSVSILWRTAPAATELESVVTGWVARLIGLEASEWHGHIEDSASTGAMLAAIAARKATGRSVILSGEQAHSSVAKAARMLGMEHRVAPADERFRLGAEAIGELDDVALVVGTVGTTACGAVDDIPSLRQAAQAAGAWLHVDAAYAGSAMLCPEFRWAFAGVGGADSLVLNAHKWMLTPMDCSLFFTRRPDALRAAFSLIPDYLRTPDSEDALSLSEYGPALGRRFRALKLWAVLRCLGATGLRAHIRSGVACAAAVERWLAEEGEGRFEVAAPRHFSLVCFRLRDADDAVNRRLLDEVNASGEAFLSGCVLGGRFTLRLAVGGPLTRPVDVRRTFELLMETAERLALGR
jgi:aromatic-L-amino-acid decarboxylase